MTAPTLYQLTGRWLSLARTLGDMDLDLQTISDTLEASEEQMAVEEKAQGYEMVARTIEANRPAIKAEIERLKALDGSLEKRASLVRSRLLDSMQTMEMQKITCPLFEISIRNNPASLDVYEEQLVPAEYWVTPEPQPHIDKDRLKADLKLGKEIQGAKLHQAIRLHVK